jgi:hypothetical protein
MVYTGLYVKFQGRFYPVREMIHLFGAFYTYWIDNPWTRKVSLTNIAKCYERIKIVTIYICANNKCIHNFRTSCHFIDSQMYDIKQIYI